MGGIKIHFVSISSSHNSFSFFVPRTSSSNSFFYLFPESPHTIPFPASMFPDKLAPRVPYSIPKNSPFSSFVLLLIVLVTPLIKTESSIEYLLILHLLCLLNMHNLTNSQLWNHHLILLILFSTHYTSN